MPSIINDPSLRRALAHIYWMGGSPCSGKSSIADLLVARYDLQLYRCDDAYDRHVKLVSPQSQPVLHRISQMTWEQIWMRPVVEQVEDELAAYREQFSLILDDLLHMPGSRPVLVEGAALLPELVAQLGAWPRAVWVVPEPEFQRYYYCRRGFIQDILKECSDPGQAFENWMARDIGFARRVRQDAEDLGFATRVVDGLASIEENASFVAGALGLAEPGKSI